VEVRNRKEALSGTKRRSYIRLSARGSSMERSMRDKEGKKDREPGLSRRAVVLVGAMLGSYIAGRVFDLIKGRR